MIYDLRLKIKEFVDRHCERGTSVAISNQHGFSPIVVMGIVLVVALVVAAVLFFRQSNTETAVTSDIPPGVVTDAEGNICETQDAEYCHESEDIETWKDDGLP